MSSASTDTFTTFGKLLKHLRRRARLTQLELGVAVGYSESYIARLEGDGRVPITGMVKARFIDALNLQHEPELAWRLIELAEISHGHPHAKAITPFTSQTKPRPNNLPTQLTRFIGRTHEVAEVNRLVRANRLVTLTGSGGVGKTRLALEAASAMLDPFANGVWMVELAALADAALVPQTVASALRLTNPLATVPTDTLCAYLAGKNLLLLLDNCEHLIQACAELADTLLRACPQLHILTTSREALHISGELTWRVPSLDANETMQLFVERASAARLDFVLTHENAAVIASIGKRLDGIPLAIELAASRLRGLSIEQLAARLGDRFLLLSDGSRTALPRHQTLRALIDWSHDLLSDQERMLLRRLSIFAGGWTAEAAEQVCAMPHPNERMCSTLIAPNVLPLLLNLVSKSLVVVEELHTHTRYRLLETIREYAWEQLVASNEVDPLRHQHARYYLAHLQESAPRAMRQSGSPLQFVLGVESDAWVKRLEQEYGNLRASLVWCLRDAHDTEIGVQLVIWLYGFWEMRGPHSEAIEWLERALTYIDPSAHAQTRAQVLTALSMSASVVGDYARSEAASIEALALCRKLDNRFELMRALQTRTSDVMHRGHYAEAQILAEEWLSLARELNNARYEGIALFWLGIMAMHQRDFARAISLHEESLQVTPSDEQGTRVVAQFYQAMVWWCQGDDERALAQCTDSLEYLRATGWAFASATVLHTMGDIVLFQGDSDQAKEYYLESVNLLQLQNARQRIVWPLAGLAALAASEDQAIRAITLWAAVDALRASLNSVDLTMSHDGYQSRIAAARAKLDASTLAAAEAAGRQMGFDQAVAYAQEG